MAESLEQIAKLAGLSVSSVSRALAGKPGISMSRRQEVLELAEKVGYLPDMEARALRTGRGSGLAIIVQLRPTQISNLRNYALFSRGKDALGSVRVLIQNKGEALEGAVRQAAASKCGAIIVSSMSGSLSKDCRDQLIRKKLPLTFMDGKCEGFDSITVSRETGTLQVAKMFLLAGCRNVFFYSNTSLERPDARLSGIIEAFRSLGCDPCTIRIIPFTKGGFQGGYEVARDLVLSGKPFDGLFCYNDEMAIGSLHALREADIRVPGDVRLIGFDDIPGAEFAAVPLTTAAQPMESIVQAALAMTQERLDDYGRETHHLSFPTRLVVRDSSPRLPADLQEQVFTAAHNQI